MSAKVYSTQLAPSTVTASSAAANYQATNVMEPEVLKPWRSTVTTLSSIIIDLGSSKAVTAVALNAVNFASCTVYADNTATPTTNRGTLTTGVDKQGRYKGALEFSATVRYIKFEIAAGTPVDGAAFWSIGAADVYALTTTLARDPLYGASVQFNTPRVGDQLPNGKAVKANIGASYAMIELPFSATASQDVEALKRLAQAEPCWLNLGVTADLQWPITCLDDSSTRRLDRYNRETTSFRLKELA